MSVQRHAGQSAAPAPLELRSFPSTDEEFAFDVRLTLDTGQPRTPEELELMLRPRFPGVAVHVRLLSDESWPTWYVFRYGRVRSS